MSSPTPISTCGGSRLIQHTPRVESARRRSRSKYPRSAIRSAPAAAPLSLREALGPGERVQWRPGMTLGDVRDHLIATSPQHAEVLARTRTLRGAINQVMCSEATAVPESAEVAFFPPVTGG